MRVQSHLAKIIMVVLGSSQWLFVSYFELAILRELRGTPKQWNLVRLVFARAVSMPRNYAAVSRRNSFFTYFSLQRSEQK